jgi:hypothetical protein
MQSSDVIEVVTHLLAAGSAKLLYSRIRVPFLRALRLYWLNRARVFHSAVQHRSSIESDVGLLVKRVEIPVIGRDGEISGVLRRSFPLTSASRSTALTKIETPPLYLHRATPESRLRATIGKALFYRRFRKRPLATVTKYRTVFVTGKGQVHEQTIHLKAIVVTEWPPLSASDGRLAIVCLRLI